MFCKKGVLRNFAKLTGKHRVCEVCEISKNTFLTEHLGTIASAICHLQAESHIKQVILFHVIPASIIIIPCRDQKPCLIKKLTNLSYILHII